MFQRDERHREKRASSAGTEKRPSTAGTEKRPSAAGVEKRTSTAGVPAPGGKRPSAGGGPGGPGGVPPHPLTCLGGIQRLAWQSLELAGPVTDIVRMQQANWFQLSGQLLDVMGDGLGNGMRMRWEIRNGTLRVAE